MSFTDRYKIHTNVGQDRTEIENNYERLCRRKSHRKQSLIQSSAKSSRANLRQSVRKFWDCNVDYMRSTLQRIFI